MNISTKKLADFIKTLGISAGFSDVGISAPIIANAAQNFDNWLAKDYAGTMNYLLKNSEKRKHPQILMSEVKSIISCALSYEQLSKNATQLSCNFGDTLLRSPQITRKQGAFAASSTTYRLIREQRSKNATQLSCNFGASSARIASYALGLDYHQIVKNLLHQFVTKIQSHIGIFTYRCFVDSGPVLEKPIAANAGLGWQGKNCLLINPKFGSWLVLGEIYTDLPLTPDKPIKNHCGSCRACIDSCPTKAIVEPYVVDARRCIAYLTIEYKDDIPPELQAAMGNHIYGCDICQRACPWNHAKIEKGKVNFEPRQELVNANLSDLAKWTREDFLTKTAGTAIQRIGYERWMRNIKIALNNVRKNSFN